MLDYRYEKVVQRWMPGYHYVGVCWIALLCSLAVLRQEVSLPLLWRESLKGKISLSLLKKYRLLQWEKDHEVQQVPQQVQQIPRRQFQQVPPRFEELEKKPKRTRRFLFIASLISVVVIIAGGLLTLYVHRALRRVPIALQTIKDVPLSGAATRFDYQSLDARTGLLVISRSGASSVLLFDTRSQKVVGEIPGIPDGHGVVTIPELGRAYVSSGTKNEVFAIDEQMHQIIATIPVGAGPDGMAYDPIQHKLFVSEENGHADAVIDVRSEKQVDVVHLDGEAGNTQYDAISHLIFVNVQTVNQLEAIDPVTDKVIAHYPLPGCTHNHGLNIDATNRLAFVACDGNEKLLEIDMHTMKETDISSVGNGPDVLALDNGRHILYVAAESGIISVFVEQGLKSHKVAEGFVSSHAHTIAVNQQTHDIYLPLENVNGRAIIKIARFQA